MPDVYNLSVRQHHFSILYFISISLFYAIILHFNILRDLVEFALFCSCDYLIQRGNFSQSKPSVRRKLIEWVQTLFSYWLGLVGTTTHARDLV